MKKIIKYITVMACAAAVICSCEESKRFEINYKDTTPPGKPEYIGYKPLYGGAMLYFKAPEDEDVLSIDASYENQKGENVWFSVSYYIDSISVLGFADAQPKKVQLYAVDRAGNRSASEEITVEPWEPAVTRIIASAFVRGGFGSFYVDWKNELMQNVNMFADFSYKQEDGKQVERHVIFSSLNSVERRFVRMEDFPDTEPVNVRLHVEDRYGNTSGVHEETVFLIHDEIIPKDKWTMLKSNDSIGGVAQGLWFEGGISDATSELFDNIIDGAGSAIPNAIYGRAIPTNMIIDLGEEWELSRIVTWQRYYWEPLEIARGEYYTDNSGNVKTYRLYVLDETQQWDLVRTHTIPVPVDLTPRQYYALGQAGDFTYFYPDDLQFTNATRWFRYEVLQMFSSTNTEPYLSEMTLYGRKAKK